MKNVRIGFDLGGTNMGSALVSLEGELIYQNDCPTLAHEPSEKVLGRMKNLIHDCFNKAKENNLNVVSIGIGSPGVIDTENGVIINSPNIPDWNNIEIVKIMNAEFNVPCAIDNDVRVAAMGEYKFGAGKGYKNILCIAIGTGIGGGIILDGKLMRGPTFSMGEIGHITLKKDGPKCGCGNYGCMEALGSSTAIIREAKNAIENNESEILKELYKENNEINTYLVAQAAEKGDKKAFEIITQAAEWVGIGLSGVVNLINPEIIIIGGGVSLAGEIIFNPIKNEIKKRSLKIPGEFVKVVPANLGDFAGMIGASALTEYKDI